VSIAGGFAVFAQLVMASALNSRNVPSKVYAGVFCDAASLQAQLRDDLDPVGLGWVVIHKTTMVDSATKSISSFGGTALLRSALSDDPDWQLTGAGQSKADAPPK